MSMEHYNLCCEILLVCRLDSHATVTKIYTKFRYEIMQSGGVNHTFCLLQYILTVMPVCLSLSGTSLA